MKLYLRKRERQFLPPTLAEEGKRVAFPKGGKGRA